jgi:hypothetical protein
MKKLNASLLTLLLLLLPAAPTFAWGGEGHKTVGKVAELHLRAENATNALNRIEEILNDGETLASIANWADTVKRKRFAANAQHPDRDTRAFLRDLRNRGNSGWHFVNLPLGCASYEACSEAPVNFTSNTDIVQMIEACIAVLQSNAPNQRFTKRNALRLLTHLVGDLHQPLHVGCGYVDPEGPNGSIQIVRNPSDIKARGLEHDVGGNILFLTRYNGEKMHGFWDGTLVDAAMGDDELEDFAESLRDNQAVDNANMAGPHSTWPAQWATDSLKVSRDTAYDSISIRRERFDHQADEEFLGYDVRSDADYKSQGTNAVKRQLAKGGVRLARLLKAIFP